MANEEEIRRKLSGLTETERKVLRAVCETPNYRAAGARLNLEEGTIKTYMSSAFRQLGLKGLDRNEKKRLLLTEIWPVLKDDKLDTPPPDRETPTTLSDDDRREVDDLEDVLRPRPRFRSLRWGCAGTLLGAVVGVALTLVILAQNVSGIFTGVAGNTPTSLPVRETVVVTSTPDPNIPTSTREILKETVIVVVTATPPPATATPTSTSTSTDTPTPVVSAGPSPTATDTPSPTPVTPVMLGIGDVSTDDRVSLAMTGYDFNYVRNNGVALIRDAIIFYFEFENDSGDTILLRFAGSDFSMVDNNGRQYECEQQPGTGFARAVSETNRSVDSYKKYTFSIACAPEIRLDRDVSYVILSVEQFSSLLALNWMAEIPR